MGGGARSSERDEEGTPLAARQSRTDRDRSHALRPAMLEEADAPETVACSASAVAPG